MILTVVRPPPPPEDMVLILEARERRSRRFAFWAAAALVVAVLVLFGTMQRAVFELQAENNRLLTELKILDERNIDLRLRCGK